MPREEPDRALPPTIDWLMIICGVICGYVDSYTLMTFDVYTSFMSGNTVSAGMHVGLARFAMAWHALLPVGPFVAGAFSGTLLQLGQSSRQRSRVFCLIATLLAASVMAAWAAWPDWLCIAGLSLAMGMMNTTITQVGGQSLNLGFVTGDLKSMASHLARGVAGTPVAQPVCRSDTHWRRAGTLASIWSAFLLGAVLGAALASRFMAWTLLVPAAALLIAATTATPAETACAARDHIEP